MVKLYGPWGREYLDGLGRKNKWFAKVRLQHTCVRVCLGCHTRNVTAQAALLEPLAHLAPADCLTFELRSDWFVCAPRERQVPAVAFWLARLKWLKVRRGLRHSSVDCSSVVVCWGCRKGSEACPCASELTFVPFAWLQEQIIKEQGLAHQGMAPSAFVTFK